MLSGKGLCIGPITRLEVSYRDLSECDLETSTMRRSMAHKGCRSMKKQNI